MNSVCSCNENCVLTNHKFLAEKDKFQILFFILSIQVKLINDLDRNRGWNSTSIWFFKLFRHSLKFKGEIGDVILCFLDLKIIFVVLYIIQQKQYVEYELELRSDLDEFI